MIDGQRALAVQSRCSVVGLGKMTRILVSVERVERVSELVVIPPALYEVTASVPDDGNSICRDTAPTRSYSDVHSDIPRAVWSWP